MSVSRLWLSALLLEGAKLITPPRMSRPSRLLVLPVVALAFLCLSAPALAGTARSDTGGDLFVFTAAAGEANHLLVLATSDGYRVVDQGAALTAGPGCIQVLANEVHCSPTENAEIYAGDMDDFVSASAEGAGLLGVRETTFSRRELGRTTFRVAPVMTRSGVASDPTTSTAEQAPTSWTGGPA